MPGPRRLARQSELTDEFRLRLLRIRGGSQQTGSRKHYRQPGNPETIPFHFGFSLFFPGWRLRPEKTCDPALLVANFARKGKRINSQQVIFR
jgi:hypothetical protein